MKTLRQRGVRMALAALLIAGGGAGVAYATVAIATGSGDVIVGCAKNNNGQLRIVGDVSQCLPSEHPVAFQAPTPSSEPQSVLVDCAAGQSINAALASVPVSVPLTVNIQGTCTEAVNISRDEVTLQAVSAGDGIQAPSADAAALVLKGASHVNLGQLTLTGGRTGLAAFKGASFSAFNLHVSGAGTGVMVNASSSGNFNQPLIEHSVQDGLAVGSGGSAQFFGGTISNSGGDGVSLSGGHVELGNTDVTGSGFQIPA